MPMDAASNTATERSIRTLPEAYSRALGNGSRLCRSLADAAGKTMSKPHGDETDEQMQHLDHPVIGTRHQAQLRHAQRRHDEAPDEDDRGKRASAAREQPDDDENPQRQDEEAAERHVQ